MVKLINDLIKTCLQVRHIGWDIAICDAKKSLAIEGNDYGHHDLQQLLLSKGLWKEPKRILGI